ncbi:MAG: crossover junction endodeoxyribonuclease RuvC [Actinobacteria bacterium]|nr:crossover junction endodeoxyribonuclease RuvC [Actinomycetota bacterium]
MSLRVLGVDPGLTRCGIAVVEGPPASPRAITAEVLRTPASQALEQRLQHVHVAVARAIAEHHPDVVACERVLFSRNVRTAMATGQAAGVALLAAAEAGVPVVHYSPNDVKLSVAGYGDADKDGVAKMVRAQLGLDETPSPADLADAYAVALTHLLRARGIAAASAPAGRAKGWESVLQRPHLRIAGGTAPGSTAPPTGGAA